MHKRHKAMALACLSAAAMLVFLGVAIQVASYWLAAVTVLLFGILMAHQVPALIALMRDERLIVQVIGSHGGLISESALDERLEQLTEDAGAYQGERMEDLREAVARLQANGRISAEGETLKLDSTAY